MSVHDPLWKSLIKAFLPEFLELILPEALDTYFADEPTFLEQEAFSGDPGGTYARMDLVAQLRSRHGPPGILLVLIEIERRFGRAMDARILSYFWHLRLKHSQPVVPIVLFLSGGPAGVERRRVVETVLGHEVTTFHYWAFGLSKAKAEDYLGRNDLTPALAACMGSGEWSPSEKKLECLLSILESEVDETRKSLLINAVKTYLDLAEEEAMKYSELVALSSRGQEVEEMETTWANRIGQEARSEGLKQGRHEGLKQGRHEGFKMSLTRLLEKRFGRLDAASRKRLDAIKDLSELERLGDRLLSAKSLADLGLSP